MRKDGRKMENHRESYMIFSANNIYFSLPVFQVENVQSAEQAAEHQEELLILNLPVLAGRGDMDYSSRYVIFMEQDGKHLGILAEEILGIYDWCPEEFILLKPPVLNEKNQYLKAVIQWNRTGEHEELVYVLEPVYLCQRALDTAWNPADRKKE